ncbi:ACP S-malonyltransferase [Marininema halotolerans]|uniref:[acyl-carrier-protein] S-malonyltransferase n=1 Tax=Marininema halotolerans TaxID=1155944 RepID=A0A1I6PQP8_9BACL|nr:ACP S-malonyltransferase [Marininema halotolerans]SFS42521.1 trans-AT polyketide synthase, acyltransferase and oxidoreductase domain-containing protein [Marininema halotolerans]
MSVYVFPGQGSQAKGMGGTLFDEFQDFTQKADQILGYSIKKLCLEDPEHQLGQTQYTQPALFVVNALSYLKKLQESGKPNYVAGHSLGEYNALFAAGAFDFETGLQLVKKRGELMSKAAGGGMAAVIGFNAEEVQRVLVDYQITGIDIANDNAPTQIVIAGLKEDIASAQETFEKAGVKMYIPLNVSGAFHSRYMVEAQKEFIEFIKDYHFSKLNIPTISNVEAMPYEQASVTRNLTKQITHQVKWTDTIRYMMGLDENEIEEIGPGDVLTRLVAQIKRKATPLVIPPRVSQATTTVRTRPLVESNAKKSNGITAHTLGSEEFKSDYGLQYAYVSGAMYRGIASEQIVVRMGKSGLMGFYGTGGLSLDNIEQAILHIQSQLNNGEAYGMNLLHNPIHPKMEEDTVALYLRYGIRNVEASAYMSMTPALVIYRAKGLRKERDGRVVADHRIIAKLSRPEVAEAFLSPAPAYIVEKLVAEGKISSTEAVLLRSVPMADDVTVEADSGGHTDLGVAYTLMPAMIHLRDEMMKKYNYSKRIRVGAAGGIGTPAAASAAFILGADYIVTGSINQCTVEAGTSDAVKDLLQQANVQDTEYAPAGDMFEMGAKVQVLKKGLFFPARANKLYDLYRNNLSIDDIDHKTRKMIEEKYFRRSFDDIYNEIKETCPSHEIEKAERNPKHKMALIFRWYFGYTTRLALGGERDQQVDFQIHCGPAIGSFNRWVRGTELEDWRKRHVDEIGIKLISETAELLNDRYGLLTT